MVVEGETIVAVATAAGVGGIAVVRVSGAEAEEICSRCWKGMEIGKMGTHTAHLGRILAGDGSVIDEVVLTLFRGPRSFTGETVIEISCHGSEWIQREIVNRLIEAGARAAGPGEFTQRAYLNGRIDLAQAEGVADLIAASSRASHRMAMRQTTGEFSSHLNSLRDRLIELASLLELELDFSEEEVEFADRERLRSLTESLRETISRLAASYKSGRGIKEGVPVVIAGAPNAGKSTLLNQLLGEEKAIVTDIAGTTRDVIEDTCEIGGIRFRFVDTAGLRTTDDMVERIGIDRAEQRISKASIILWMLDMSAPAEEVNDALSEIRERVGNLPDISHILVCNKQDEVSGERGIAVGDYFDEVISISAKEGTGVEELRGLLVSKAQSDYNLETDIIISNARHYESLKRGAEALERLSSGLTDGLSGDFLAQDLREALFHVGEVTGTISTPDLLKSIFENFCIGK